uniref:Uncharacterized protein n=2 Tax=Lotharella globosa TaxID=91324 RepID=A0A7S3YPN8_9EUKA
MTLGLDRFNIRNRDGENLLEQEESIDSEELIRKDGDPPLRIETQRDYDKARDHFIQAMEQRRKEKARKELEMRGEGPRLQIPGIPAHEMTGLLNNDSSPFVKKRKDLELEADMLGRNVRLRVIEELEKEVQQKKKFRPGKDLPPLPLAHRRKSLEEMAQDFKETQERLHGIETREFKGSTSVKLRKKNTKELKKAADLREGSIMRKRAVANIPPPPSAERALELEQSVRKPLDFIRKDIELRKLMARPEAADPEKFAEMILQEKPELASMVLQHPSVIYRPMKAYHIKQTRSYKSYQHVKMLKKKKHNPGRSRMRAIREEKWAHKFLNKHDKRALGQSFTPYTKSARGIPYSPRPKINAPPLVPTEVILTNRQQRNPHSAQIRRKLEIQARKKVKMEVKSREKKILAGMKHKKRVI